MIIDIACLQVYGYQGIKSSQSSEHLIGRFVNSNQNTSQPLVVGTKFFTVPWTNALVGGGFRLGRQSMIAALRASLKRMNRDKIDLYQVIATSQTLLDLAAPACVTCRSASHRFCCSAFTRATLCDRVYACAVLSGASHFDVSCARSLSNNILFSDVWGWATCYCTSACVQFMQSHTAYK